MKKQKQEPIISPVAQAYMNMVNDSINRMEASDDKPSTQRKEYIECLKESVRRAPEFFKNYQFPKSLTNSKHDFGVSHEAEEVKYVIPKQRRKQKKK